MSNRTILYGVVREDLSIGDKCKIEVIENGTIIVTKLNEAIERAIDDLHFNEGLE